MGAFSLVERASFLNFVLQMSKFLVPALYKKTALENQLRNCIYGIHDLICGCDKVPQHIHNILCSTPCHHSETTTETGENLGKKDDVLEDGDLDALFAASDDVAG